MANQNRQESAYERLTEALKDLGIPFEVFENGEYTDLTLMASASDKSVTLTFVSGVYSYGN